MNPELANEAISFPAAIGIVIGALLGIALMIVAASMITESEDK